MVENATTSTNNSTNANIAVPATNLFKFCYILRGIPGSGKSTVAAQLAGSTGVVINLDQNVVRHHSETGSTVTEADTMVEIQEKHYAEFCAEILRGTPIIVVDNNNIKESEYLHFVEFAHKEHYIASIVTLPPPTSIELASQRSSQGVTPNQVQQMLSMFEPASLSKLARKGADMHEMAERSLADCRLSPRGGVNRRSSSHFRDIPTDMIPEDSNAKEDADNSSEEEQKRDDTAPA